jgi:hypothetical protein
MLLDVVEEGANLNKQIIEQKIDIKFVEINGFFSDLALGKALDRAHNVSDVSYPNKFTAIVDAAKAGLQEEEEVARFLELIEIYKAVLELQAQLEIKDADETDIISKIEEQLILVTESDAELMQRALNVES